MSEPFSLAVAAKPLVGLLLSIGADKIQGFVKQKRLVSRAVGKAASRCAGFAPGGERRVKENLNAWTSSLEFNRFLTELGRGEDLERVLEHGLDSFIAHSGFQQRDRAERLLAELLQALKDEIYDASRAAMMRRHEQMYADTSSRLDANQNTLSQISNALRSLTEPVREAVEQYLSESHKWKPLDELLKKGALTEAADELEQRIERLDKLWKEQPEAERILSDHRQELLLKLAAVFSQRGQLDDAKRIYEQAKAFGFTKPERRQQALTVLFNLKRVEEYEALLREEEDLPEPEKAELNLLVLKEAWDQVAEQVPDDAAEFRPLYLAVHAELQRDHTEETFNAAELATRLDRIEEVTEDHPLHKVQLAAATIQLLDRVVREMLEAPGLDRIALVDAARTRTEEALDACVSVDPDAGYHYVMLKEAYTLYSLLEDEERLRELEQQYNAAIGEAPPTKEWDEALSQGRISQAHYLFLTADALLENPAGAQAEKAIPLLQSALHLAQEQRLRNVIAERLISLYLKQDDQQAAEGVLQQLAEAPAHDLALLETPIVYRRDGRSAAIEHLTEAVQRFPRSLPVRRFLAELLIAEISHRDGAGSSISALTESVDEVASHGEILQQVLPTAAHDLFAVRACFAARDYTRAVALLTSIVASPGFPLKAGLMRVRTLAELHRFDEAAEQMADLAERTSDPVYATNAAAYWMNVHEYERVITFLEPWVDRYPEDPFLAANLAITLIVARADNPNEGRRAFNLLARACRHHSSMKDIRLWMSTAATIAGKEEIARRYFRKAMPEQPPILVREKEDFNALSEVAGEGFTPFHFDGDKALRAFVEWQQERIQTLNRLLKADLLSYGDLFRRNGRPWEHWIQWTQAASEQFKEHSGITVVKAPWPFTESHQDPKRGLLLDLTALLTLSVLSDAENLLRTLDAAGRRPYVRSSELDELNSAVASLADYLFVPVRHAYESLVGVLRRYDLLPFVTEEDIDRYYSVVPDPLREHLGNNALDFGLTRVLGDAVFVSDRHDTTNYEPEAQESTIITSASLLRALVDEGIVGADAADHAAETDNRFLGWREAPEIEIPKQVVISAFALPDWFEAGLLTSDEEGWLRREPEWPRLHVGPFARKHLLEQANEQQTKRLKTDAAARLYATLRRLIAEEVVEVLPDEDTAAPADSYDPQLLGLWPHVLNLLHLAERYDLDIWADDRVVGYFLWPFGHPLPIPQLTQEIQRIRQTYSNVQLHTTEGLLEALSDSGHLEEQRAEKLGYELLRLGYRPLRFRLALAHLFRNYAYKSGSPRYQPLLQALQALLVTPAPPPKESESYPVLDHKPLQRLLYASILPDLISLVWNAPVSRSIDERRALANDLLSLVLAHLAEHEAEVEDGMTSFWISLLVHTVAYRARTTVLQGMLQESTDDEEEEGPMQEALEWFTDAVTQHEHGERRKRIVRGIEDYVLDFLISGAENIVARAKQESEKPDVQLSPEQLSSHIMAMLARRMQPYLYPLFNSDLLNDFDPLLRRALGVLAHLEREFKVVHLVTVPDQEYKLEVTEEEQEQFALSIVHDAFRGDPKAAELIQPDLTVKGYWHRLVPQDERDRHTDLPERHPVPFAVSIMTLLLRDDTHKIPELIEWVLSQLQLIDPTLGQDLLDLKTNLLSEDEAERRRARERLALSLLHSPYFELQRDLAHVDCPQ